MYEHYFIVIFIYKDMAKVNMHFSFHKRAFIQLLKWLKNILLCKIKIYLKFSSFYSFGHWINLISYLLLWDIWPDYIENIKQLFVCFLFLFCFVFCKEFSWLFPDFVTPNVPDIFNRIHIRKFCRHFYSIAWGPIIV